MAELPGQLDILDAIKDELENPSASRAFSILDMAAEHGWTENPYTSLVVRLTHPEGKPFFARWDLSLSESGKRSWRFQGARAQNGQALNFNDVKLYLQDPSVIEPEMPDELCEAAGMEDSEQGMASALKALDPIAAVPSSANWGAILG